MYTGLHVEYLLHLSDLDENLILSTHFRNSGIAQSV